MKFIKIRGYYINPDKIAYFFYREKESSGYGGWTQVHFVGDDASCICLDNITPEVFIECLKSALMDEVSE